MEDVGPEEVGLQCPYCGESITMVVEPAYPQSYVEDCEVCCRPIRVSYETDSDGRVRVQAEREGN